MEELYDVIVVGGGPAGLTGALYLARAGCRVLVLEKDRLGGQIAITEEVVNYPGIETISGQALTESMKRQAEHFGAELQHARVTGLAVDGPVKTVHTDRGDYRCLGLLLATGAQPRTVGFVGEDRYRGRGVAYCATCDGEFFTGRDVFVVGGGYAAAEESVFLTRFARHVTVLIRKPDFSCAASVARRAKEHEKITVLTNTVLEEVSGSNGLTYARYKNTATGEVTEVRRTVEDSFGVFVLAGYAPDTELVRQLLQCNEQGYLLTDATQKTSVDGVYAAGDVCVKPLRQVVTATADGALAAVQLEKYVTAMREQTGLPAKAGPSKPREETSSGDVFSPELRQQLDTLFSKMEQPLMLRLYLDRRPVSGELERFAAGLAALTDRLSVTVAEEAADEDAPCVQLCRADGTPTGLSFHGVPGGHEFTSFVLGLYNAAGPGQPLDAQTLARIAAIRKPTELKLLVTLSCSMCPELVIAAQHVAAQNPLVTASVYDVRHFEDLRQQYQLMSVPCLVINNDQVHFGRKTMDELLTLLGV